VYSEQPIAQIFRFYPTDLREFGSNLYASEIDMPTQSSVIMEETSRFAPLQLAALDRSRIPKHIAIIPDGNRRWAKKRLSSAQEGHQEGADVLMDIVQAAQELDVRVITFYSFSTENWTRPPEEVQALMALFAAYLVGQKDEMVRTGIKLETIGNLCQLPPYLQKVIEETKQATAFCSGIRLVLALNYGGRDELCRAFQAMLDDYDRGRLKKEEVTERVVSQYLDSAAWEDPELLIRTSGELRISNFLLWQISYTEMHVAPVLWPDFRPHHLLDAILDYQKRERRWGGS
jgi:undecaprenyl diphosphate synthase